MILNYGDPGYGEASIRCDAGLCKETDNHVAHCRNRGARLVDSASDERVINNVMRHAYRVLGEGEKEQMRRVKDLGLKFVEALHEIGGSSSEFSSAAIQDDVRQSSRELAIAQTKVEEAVMWAVKHITR